MLVVSFVVTVLILGIIQPISLSLIAIALIVAILATFLETFSKFGIDNLTVPLGSAILAFSLSQFIP
jgi:phytol kinase